MDISYITEYISPVALVICLAAGYIIKNLVPNDAVNRFIPCIVAVLGVAIVVWGEFAISPDILAAGLISGLASTGLYEAFEGIIGGRDA